MLYTNLRLNETEQNYGSKEVNPHAYAVEEQLYGCSSDPVAFDLCMQLKLYMSFVLPQFLY